MQKEMEQTLNEEKAVMNLLLAKFKSMQMYSPSDAEYLTQSLAEIMVLSKDLYTRLLPEMANTSARDKNLLWEELTGARMHLMHMKDCIEEFNSNLLDLIERDDNEEEEIEEEETEE